MKWSTACQCASLAQVARMFVRSIARRSARSAPLRQAWLHGFRHPWVWWCNGALLLLYACIGWLFPAGVRRCGDVLVRRPELGQLGPQRRYLVGCVRA